MSDQNIRSGTVTAVRDQARHPDRVSIFIDEAFAFGVDRLVAAEHGLRPGVVLDEGAVAQLLAADEVSRAMSAALRLLAHRPRSRAEVATRLTRRAFSEAAIARAVDRLVELGYLDDEEFARYWVQNRVEHKPRGGRLLKQELRQKGVDAGTADLVIEGTGIDEEAAAIELARARAERLRGLDPAARRRRLAGFLRRRGYGWEVVRRALDEALGPEDEE